MYEGKTYTGSLIPALSGDALDSDRWGLDDYDWNKIHYILNTYYGVPGYSINEIQAAIHHFSEGKVVYGDAAAMVADANLNGKYYYPSGENVWVAFILDCGETIQMNFIQIDP